MSYSQEEESGKAQAIARLNNCGAFLLASGDVKHAVQKLKQAMVLLGSIAETVELVALEDNAFAGSLDIPGLNDEKSSFFVFNKAVLLREYSKVDLALANAVLILNLALVFHQRGKTHCDDDKLRKAIHFYHLCSQQVMDLPTSSGTVLLLACLNNKADAHFALGEYDMCEEVLESIGSLAEYVPTAEDCSGALMEEEKWNEIFLNVAVIRAPTTAPTA